MAGPPNGPVLSETVGGHLPLIFLPEMGIETNFRGLPSGDLASGPVKGPECPVFGQG
jgi:hypothetical protein